LGTAYRLGCGVAVHDLGYLLGAGVMDGDFIGLIVAFVLVLVVFALGVAAAIGKERDQERACEREHNVYDCVRVYVPAEDTP
jgi:hypothetical protein